MDYQSILANKTVMYLPVLHDDARVYSNKLYEEIILSYIIWNC